MKKSNKRYNNENKNDWKFHKHCEDIAMEIMNDFQLSESFTLKAIKRAYITGLSAGGMDNSLFEAALEEFKVDDIGDFE